MIERLIDALGRFAKSKILVIGDLMLDVGCVGSAERISPEAPILILNVEEEAFEPGGAANAAMNARMLGSGVEVMGLVGDDEAGDHLISRFADAGIEASLVLRDPKRPTTQKTRAFARGTQLIRFDYEDASPVEEALLRQLLKGFEERASWYDAVLLSDYGKGMGEVALYRPVIERCKRNRIPVLIDPKAGDPTLYGGADLIKPNEKEAAAMAGSSLESQSVEEIGPLLVDRFDASVLITCGAQGMVLWEKEGPHNPFRVPSLATRVQDVTGAGDTVSAAMALSLGNRLTQREGSLLSSICAAIAVSKQGTAKADASEVLSYLQEEELPQIPGDGR